MVSDESSGGERDVQECRTGNEERRVRRELRDVYRCRSVLVGGIGVDELEVTLSHANQ